MTRMELLPCTASSTRTWVSQLTLFNDWKQFIVDRHSSHSAFSAPEIQCLIAPSRLILVDVTSYIQWICDIFTHLLLTEGRPPGQRTLSHAASSKKNSRCHFWSSSPPFRFALAWTLLRLLTVQLTTIEVGPGLWFPAHWAPVVLQQLQHKESYRAAHSSWMDQEEAPADMLTGTIPADWTQLPVERYLAALPTLRHGVIDGVFRKKGAAPWAITRAEKQSCSSRCFFPMICHWMIGMQKSTPCQPDFSTVPVAFFEAGFQLQKSSRFWRHGGRCASRSVFAASSSVFAVKDTRAEAAQSTTQSCPQSSRQGAQSQGEADDPFAQTLAKAEAIRPSWVSDVGASSQSKSEGKGKGSCLEDWPVCGNTCKSWSPQT